MADRGVIRNIEFLRQSPEFRGMRWGNITPTDLDGFLDFKDRLFVFVEAKHGGAVPDTGQRLALERLCGACHQPPRRSAVAFLVSHNDTGPTYRMATATVASVLWEGVWKARKVSERRTLLQEIDAVRIHCRLEPAANEQDPWLAAYEREEAIHWTPKTAKELWRG